MKKSKLLLSFAIAPCSVGVLSSGGMEVKKVEAAETAYKTLTFSSETNSKGVSSYSGEWSATIDGFTWTIKNFNNNNNGWSYVKCGSKNNAYVGEIITGSYIDEKIEKVVVKVDSCTVSSVNSTSLVVSDDENFSNVIETVDVTIKTGELT